MKCEICELRDAVFHIKQVKEDEDTTLHLCEVCAGQRGIPLESSESDLSLDALLSGLIEEASLNQRQTKTKKCPLGGLTFERFQKKPLAGCHECYTVFSRDIRRIIARRFGPVRHRGKFPKRLMVYKSFLCDMAQLKKRLKAAVKEEQYEKAAELRDKINAIQSNPGSFDDG